MDCGSAVQFAPAAVLPRRFLKHPGADGEDQAGLLGQGYEGLGRNGSEGGMIPANQCFDADDFSVAIDLGLIMKEKFISFDGMAEGAFQLEAGDDAVAHFGSEYPGAVASGFLGAVEGEVGVAQEGSGIRTVAGKIAAPMVTVIASSRPPRFIGFLNSLTRSMATRSASAGLDSVERMAANSSPPMRARVSEARRRRLQAGGDLAEQFVAIGMTVGVVDQFEAIDVDQQNRQRMRSCAPPSARACCRRSLNRTRLGRRVRES